MTSFPFENLTNLPLSAFPFNSRVETSELILSDHKNYGLVGFRPGFPLQASELNEIQEIMLLNNSLTSTMQSLWQPIDLTEQYQAPGWLGSTPLWPEKFDSANTENLPTTNLFEYTASGDTYKFTAKKGWYFVHVKSSGFKHWVYLDTDISTPDLTINSNTLYIGFNVVYSRVGVSTDPSLFDNSSTNIARGSAAGADRIKINIRVENGLVSTNDYQESNFSPIARLSSSITQRAEYMNRRAVPVAS